MFFWMVLASLMGVVMFGSLHEKTKEQADFVVPVYQAMALSTYQQHLAAERGYMDAMRYNDSAKTYINSINTGIVQLAVANNNALTGENDTLLGHIRRNLPTMYKAQNGTRSYLLCMTAAQTASKCNLTDTVKYIATIRPMPEKYSGAAKMTVLRAIADATNGSRFVGLLKPISNSATSSYYIQSGGNSSSDAVVLPDYITCKFPMASGTLGAALNNDYIVALTAVEGNLETPVSNNLSCSGG